MSAPAPPREDQLPQDTSRRSDLVVACGVGLAALVVYLATLLPGIGYSGDTAKWQLLGKVGGIAHATGYPLYIALEQAWVAVVPFGSVAWRVNLLSAVLAASAVAVLFALLRTLGVRRGVAAATALVFAGTATFWSQAVVAEVYALHVFLLVTITACVARWRTGGANGWLAGLGLLALSFGNHLTTAIAVPGIAWIVWSDRRRAWRPANVAFVVAAALLGAAQYLYLLRLSDVGGYQERTIDTLGDIVDYVTGGEFRDSMGTFGIEELVRDRARLLFAFLRQEYSLLLAPIALGVVLGLRSPSAATRAVAVHLAWLGVGTSLYVMQYDVPDLVVFCIPLFLSCAAFLGLGLDGVADRLADRRAEGGWSWTGPAAGAALAAAVAAVFVVNWSEADQSGTVADADRIERALDAAGTCAVLLTDDYPDSEYFWYHLLAEGRAESHDLVLANQVTPPLVAEYVATGGGDVGWVAEGIRTCEQPSIYTATPTQAEALAAIGLDVTPIDDDVWRVER